MNHCIFMVNFILEAHRFCYTRKVFLKNQGRQSLCGKAYMIICKILEQVALLIIAKRQQAPSPNKCSADDIVISLTSFPARIGKVWIVIDSLLRQTVTPSKIVIYLSKMNFPQQEHNLPYSLLRYLSNSVEIRWVEDDLKPHKKYIYAFQDFENKIIVTVDDDQYYRHDMLERLIKMHKKYPNAVCANNVHDISIINNTIAPYRYWGKNLIYTEEPNHFYLAVGFGGVLYPAHCFNNTDIFDVSVIKKTCLNADDLWLKAHELLCDIPVVTFGYYASPININTHSYGTLSNTNVSETENGGNDVQWENLDKIYKLNDILMSKISQHSCDLNSPE